MTGPARHRPPQQVTDPGTGRTLVVRRAWPRGPGRVHLELVTGRPGDAPVAAQWFADPTQLAHTAARTPAPAAAVPELGVLLQPRGADRRLRPLAALAGRPGTTLLVHRPERRAVLRRGPAYVKVVPPERVPTLAAAAQRVAAAAGDYQVPDLLDRHDARGLLTFAALPGRTLLDLGHDPTVPEAVLARAWRDTGRALAALHRAGPQRRADAEAAGAPVHDAQAEAATTQEWLAAAAGLGLLPPVDGTALLADLLTEPAGPLGLLHRDLHDQQVLIPDEGPPGLIDADTAAAGERALDLANLLEHVRWRRTQGLLTPHRAALAREELLAGYAATPATLARVPAYTQATRLRLAAVYAFRPRWRPFALTLLADTVGAAAVVRPARPHPPVLVSAGARRSPRRRPAR